MGSDRDPSVILPKKKKVQPVTSRVKPLSHFSSLHLLIILELKLDDMPPGSSHFKTTNIVVATDFDEEGTAPDTLRCESHPWMIGRAV